MADFTIKANDQLPVISAVLGLAGAGPVDLTGASVDFIMRKTNSTAPAVNAAATVTDAAAGAVSYEWLQADTHTPGTFQAEWEVTFSDGKKQTFPTKSYHSIEILADLDEDVVA